MKDIKCKIKILNKIQQNLSKSYNERLENIECIIGYKKTNLDIEIQKIITFLFYINNEKLELIIQNFKDHIHKDDIIKLLNDNHKLYKSNAFLLELCSDLHDTGSINDRDELLDKINTTLQFNNIKLLDIILYNYILPNLNEDKKYHIPKWCYLFAKLPNQSILPTILDELNKFINVRGNTMEELLNEINDPKTRYMSEVIDFIKEIYISKNDFRLKNLEYKYIEGIISNIKNITEQLELNNDQNESIKLLNAVQYNALLHNMFDQNEIYTYLRYLDNKSKYNKHNEAYEIIHKVFKLEISDFLMDFDSMIIFRKNYIYKPNTEQYKNAEFVSKIYGGPKEIIKYFTKKSQEIDKLVIESNKIKEKLNKSPNNKLLIQESKKILNKIAYKIDYLEYYENNILNIINIIFNNTNSIKEKFDMIILSSFNTEIIKILSKNFKPTIEEIASYCIEKENLKFDLKTFLNLYFLFETKESNQTDEYSKISDVQNLPLIFGEFCIKKLIECNYMNYYTKDFYIKKIKFLINHNTTSFNIISYNKNEDSFNLDLGNLQKNMQDLEKMIQEQMSSNTHNYLYLTDTRSNIVAENYNYIPFYAIIFDTQKNNPLPSYCFCDQINENYNLCDLTLNQICYILNQN